MSKFINKVNFINFKLSKCFETISVINFMPHFLFEKSKVKFKKPEKYNADLFSKLIDTKKFKIKI